MTKQIVPADAHTRVRHILSTFHAEHEPLSLIPLDTPDAWTWEMFDVLLKAFNPGGLILLAPPFWQIEFLFHAACRRASLPVVSTHPHNISVAREIIHRLGIEGVVATQQAATMLRDEFSRTASSSPVRFWHIMLASDERPLHNDSDIFYEYHALPALPALFQCSTLTGTSHFHLSDSFYWELDAQGALITLRGNVSPLKRYRTPWRLSKETSSNCVCGRAVTRLA